MQKLALLFLPALILHAQAPTAPVIQPRGIVNAYTQLPAPGVVGQGGLIHINGINLAPPAGWKADTLPLPTSFGDPATQVLINNRPAPLIEATPSRIIAQVPLETPNGLVNVIVRRGDQQSRPARIQVQAIAPSLKAANGAGFGPAANQGSNGTLRLSASSLGPTEPRIPTGEAATDAVAPRAAIRAYVGGIPAEATATYSTTLPGDFSIEIKTPANAQPGDLILLASGAAEANLLTLDQARRTSEVVYIPAPNGTPDLRSLRSSDLDGLHLNANAVRGADTCYPSFQIDARKKEFRKIEACLTTAQAQALTPFVDGNSSNLFAAFEGPFKGTAQAGQPTPISDKIKIFHPNATVTANLPEMASNLNSQAGGDFVATIPASAGVPAKNYQIDPQTGSVEEFTPGGGGAGGGGGANLQALLQRFQNLDLGDGVNRLLSPLSQVANQILITAGDRLDNPTKAKVALLSAQGEIVSQRNFPAGWLPLTAPAPPQQPQQPQLAQRTPTPVYLDTQTRNYYVAVRNSENKHGWAYFPPEGDAQLIAIPDGWYLTACVANIPVFNLELARGVALLGSSVDDRAFKTPCPSEGFLLFDLAQRRFQAVSLPGSGKFNASGGADEINDFLTGANFDPANRNTSDTFYALDSVNATIFRFDLPTGVNGFSNATRVPVLNQIIAQANNRVAGDAGLVVFDLERTESRLLPTPDGFANINLLGVLPALRRLVARGIRTGNSGSQILVYNLENGDLEIIPNPDGVTWIGTPPQQQQQQPQQAAVNIPPRLNPKSGTVEAIAFGEDRRQKGVVMIRVN